MITPQSGYISVSFFLAWALVHGIAAAGGQDPADSDCHVDLPSSEAAVPYSGAVNQVSFQTDPVNCAANPQSQVDWVSVSVVPPGSNVPPVLQYAVQPNLSFHPRTASISIGDQSLTVSQAAGIQPGIAGPSSLDWVVQGKSPKPEEKILRVGSDDPALSVTAAPNPQAVAWLSVRKRDEEDRTFAISVNVRDLKAGTYEGQVVIHAAGAKNDPLSIPVTVKVLP